MGFRALSACKNFGRNPQQGRGKADIHTVQTRFMTFEVRRISYKLNNITPCMLCTLKDDANEYN